MFKHAGYTLRGKKKGGEGGDGCGELYISKYSKASEIIPKEQYNIKI